MNLSERKEVFIRLGQKISAFSDEETEQLAVQAQAANAWFTRENITDALEGIAFMLSEEKLDKWLNNYDLTEPVPKITGIVMAGNIPMVGFHDMLCVLISGHFAAIKPSSSDDFLTRKMIEWITELGPAFKKNIEIRDKLTNIDAVLATGSDNTSRYFESYFSHIPHIIRKNRTSVAILSGDESEKELEDFGADVFNYFGLGCRNVSKVFTPKGYDLKTVLDRFESYQDIINHHKYRNNYDYHKSIYLVNKTPHLDNGFLLVTSTDDLVSPISVLFHQEYENEESMASIIEANREKIQCVVGKEGVAFGMAQRPELWDYADDIDVMKFLQDLS